MKVPKSGKVRSVLMAGEVEKALARLLVYRGNPDPDARLPWRPGRVSRRVGLTAAVRQGAEEGWTAAVALS